MDALKKAVIETAKRPFRHGFDLTDLIGLERPRRYYSITEGTNWILVKISDPKGLGPRFFEIKVTEKI